VDRSVRSSAATASSRARSAWRYDALIPTRDVPILTDAFAPVDALLLE
jgi:hypothetical protein